MTNPAFSSPGNFLLKRGATLSIEQLGEPGQALEAKTELLEAMIYLDVYSERRIS